MSKKIEILNSPWGRSFERPSDCRRWVDQGHAEMIGDALKFKERFLQSLKRASVEFDPEGFDDGVVRRWSREGDSMQLKRLVDVGTDPRVSKLRDKLRRRQGRKDPGRVVVSFADLGLKVLA